MLRYTRGAAGVEDDHALWIVSLFSVIKVPIVLSALIIYTIKKF